MKKRWIVIGVTAGVLALGAAMIPAAKKGLEFCKDLHTVIFGDHESEVTEEYLNAMSERATSLLEERYGEKFVCVDIGAVTGMYGGILYYNATCAPARDESLRFSVDLNMGEDKNYYITAEYYAAQIANRELSREISQEFVGLWGNYRAECEINERGIWPRGTPDSNDETTIQAVRDGTLDWQSFLRHCGYMNEKPGECCVIEMYILVDESSAECSLGEEYDAIVKAVEKYREIVSPLDVRFEVNVYTTPGELYGKCVDILNSHRYAYIQPRHIDVYRILKNDGRGHIAEMDDISDGVAWTLDKQGYIEERKAVLGQ